MKKRRAFLAGAVVLGILFQPYFAGAEEDSKITYLTDGRNGNGIETGEISGVNVIWELGHFYINKSIVVSGGDVVIDGPLILWNRQGLVSIHSKNQETMKLK